MSEPRQTASSHRLDSIDALRGLAALSVALYHIWGHDGTYPWPSIGVVTQSAAPHLLSYFTSPLRWGYLGVGLFLVLSGFCIHLPFARKRAVNADYKFEAKTFYLRRMWRLYPAYFVSVVGTFFVLTVFAERLGGLGAAPSFADLATHLTMTHGFFDKYFYGIVHVYWSLALEFQLYLAYPLFLLLFRKWGTGRSLIVLAAASLVWRYFAMTYWGSNLISVAETGPYTMMGSVLARMPEWLLGAWLAELYVSGAVKRMSRGSYTALGITLFFVATLATLSRPMWVSVDLLFGLSFASFVAAAVHSPERAGEPKGIYRRLVWLGTVSYTVYLFHMQLSWPFTHAISAMQRHLLPFSLRLLILICSIPVLGVIYRFVEAPFLRAPRSNERFFRLYSAIERALGIKREEVHSELKPSVDDQERSPAVRVQPAAQ